MATPLKTVALCTSVKKHFPDPNFSHPKLFNFMDRHFQSLPAVTLVILATGKQRLKTRNFAATVAIHAQKGRFPMK